jgi:glycosyltransferase involved in cell wall biosynthesis
VPELRILMLCDYFPPHLGGGVERVAAELCHGLVRHGHKVTVLTLKTCPAPANEVIGGLTICRVPALDLTRWLGIQSTTSVPVIGALARLIRSFRPDLIHAHNLFSRTTEVAALLRTMCHVPLVTTLHLGRLEGGSRPLRALVRTYELTMGRYIVRRSDHVTCVSNAVAEHARRIGGYVTPVTVIPNGVDTSLFHPRPGRNNSGEAVLFVGRLVPNKGPETLIKAVPLVLAQHPQAQFLIVGDGPLRVRLKEQAHKLDVGEAVQFLGIRKDVPDLMREAALLVRPSSLEGMPLVVLEAMASAIPTVATPVGGTPELVKDGVHGFLVPVDSSAALAKAITRLLDDRPLAREMGRRGRELVEDGYSWDAVVDKTERVYAEVKKASD